MDAIDRQISEVEKKLEEYGKTLDKFSMYFTVNPLGYEASPMLSQGSKEDLVIDALIAYRDMLDIRSQNMLGLIRQIEAKSIDNLAATG